MSDSKTEWRTDDMPQDGSMIYVRTVEITTYRFQTYHPKSEQARRGVKGRWQVINEFGGWDNCRPPKGRWTFEWTPNLEDLQDEQPGSHGAPAP